MSASLLLARTSDILTVTTIIVLLYPLVRLAPFWRQRGSAHRIIRHRQELAATEAALAETRDPDELARLQAARAHHQAALQRLAPGDVAA
jgi:hypothetical protein